MIINFDWHGSVTATVFHFLMGGEEMCVSPCVIAFVPQSLGKPALIYVNLDLVCEIQNNLQNPGS